MRHLLLAAVLLAPTLGFADNRTPDVSKMKTDDCARARKLNKQCVLDMGTEILEGNAPGGDGTRIDILGFAKAGSLISIRRDFITEILKSAEDID